MLVAPEARSWPLADMAKSHTAPIHEDQRKGWALRALREERGLTQEAAAAACSPPISVQAWQNYEAGRRRFKPQLVKLVLAALSASPLEWDAAIREVPEPGDDRPSPVAGDGPGLIGIVTADGALTVARFDHLAGGRLYARGINDNGMLEYDLNHVLSVHAVNLRGM